jgi:hypothetical protein
MAEEFVIVIGDKIQRVMLETMDRLSDQQFGGTQLCFLQ